MRPRGLRRNRAVQLVRAQLARRGGSYFLLLLILSATGLAGFLASVGLRWAGLASMAVRYPVCVALAYLVFLFQIYLVVLFHRRHHGRAGGPSDAGDQTLDSIDVVDAGTDVAVFSLSGDGSTPVASGEKGSSWLDGLGGDAGGDDGFAAVLVVIVIVALVVAAVVAALLVLVEAPVLLAEVLVDGALLAGMARRMRLANPHDWVFSVIRRTWLRAVVVAVLFAVGGILLSGLSPGATTVGEALHGAR